MTQTLTNIARACAKAWDHIGTKTFADASPVDIRACIRSDSVRLMDQRLQELVLRKDVTLHEVEDFLQVMNRTYKMALQQRREGRMA